MRRMLFVLVVGLVGCAQAHNEIELGMVTRWRAIADEIHAEVCEKGFDPELNSFVQSYGSKELDASLLQLALVGFLPATDPRIVGTIEAIERQLMWRGLVLRYRSSCVDDGLPAGDGAPQARDGAEPHAARPPALRGEAGAPEGPQRALNFLEGVGLKVWSALVARGPSTSREHVKRLRLDFQMSSSRTPPSAQLSAVAFVTRRWLKRRHHVRRVERFAARRLTLDRGMCWG